MKDKSRENTQKNENTYTVDKDIHSDRSTDPHWLINELNEILEKGMFKNG